MNSALTSALAFFVILGCISSSDIYPSIHWFPHNPVFQSDEINCGSGPRELKVQLQAKIIFICPNTATVLQTSSTAIQATAMFENLWLLEKRTAFDECDVSLDPNARLLLICHTPLKLTYTSLTFARFTAEADGLTFNGGETYYFIATSDGVKSHINNTSGGRCMDNNMKIEVYVCKRSNQTYQDPECHTGVGKLICPPATSGRPSSSTLQLTPTDSSITTPSTEEISAVRSIQPSSSVKPSETVYVQTVVTKTVCDKSASFTDLSKLTVSSVITATKTMTTTEATTKTVTSGVLVTKTVEPLNSLATEPTPTAAPTPVPTTAPLRGGPLNGTIGTIMTPNFPNLYPANVTYNWTILVQPGNRLRLSFVGFAVDPSDSLRVFQGGVLERTIPSRRGKRKRSIDYELSYEEVLAEDAGDYYDDQDYKDYHYYDGRRKKEPYFYERRKRQQVPLFTETISGNGQLISIVFMSDGSVEASGFSATFEVERETDGGEETTDSSGNRSESGGRIGGPSDQEDY